MIIGGDFNTYLDIKVDKKGGKPERSSRYTDKLLSLMEEFGLKDIWRQRNTEDLKFTRREHTKAGIVQSRLDYFLVSGIVTYNILDTSIKPGCKSVCLFGVLRRFQHCTGHITTGSWKGRGNQYI